MDGLSFHVECRYACWGKDDVFFLGVFSKVGEERGFTGSGAACKKDEVVCFVHGFECRFEFLCEFQFFGHSVYVISAICSACHFDRSVA